MIDSDSGVEQTYPSATSDAWKKLLAASASRASASTGVTPDNAALQAAISKLEFTTTDGLTTRPLYTRDDLQQDVSLATARRQSAYRISQTSAHTGGIPGAWDIRQKIRSSNIPAANRLVLGELSQGASSVHLCLRSNNSPGDDKKGASQAGWLTLENNADAHALTDDVYLELITLSLESALPDKNLRDYVSHVYQARNLSGEQIRLAINNNWYTPAFKQQVKPSAEELSSLATSIRESIAAGEHVSYLAADSRGWHNLGCNRIEEIAIACANALAHLDMLRDLGLTLEQANKQIVFHIAIDQDFFANIIKLRALREIWGYLLSHAEGTTSAPQLPTVHAHTSLRMLSLLDSDNNQLRNTIACAAAAIGGADSISVEPHRAGTTFPAVDPDEDTYRIARNIQHVLMQESNLYRVQDPMGGSPFIEAQTTETMEKVWQLLQEIQSSGGIEKNIVDGSLLKRVADNRQQRSSRISKRSLPIVGVSEFATNESLFDTHADATTNADETTTFRDSAVFEALRANTYRNLTQYSIDHVEQTPGATACHLICFGKPVMYRARAGFARNLISAAGLTCSDVVLENLQAPENSDDGSLDEQLKQHKDQLSDLAPICVLCGDDDSYRHMAPALTRSLKEAGTKAVVLAGKTTTIFKNDNAGAGEQHAWDHDMHAGCNVVELASSLQALLGHK